MSLLIEFNHTDSDNCEAIANVLLTPMRLACGKEITVTRDQQFEEQDQIHIIFRLVIGAMAFTALLPTTLIGMVIHSFSSSHDAIYQLYFQSLSQESTQNNTAPPATTAEAVIAARAAPPATATSVHEAIAREVALSMRAIEEMDIPESFQNLLDARLSCSVSAHIDTKTWLRDDVTYVQEHAFDNFDPSRPESLAEIQQAAAAQLQHMRVSMHYLVRSPNPSHPIDFAAQGIHGIPNPADECEFIAEAIIASQGHYYDYVFYRPDRNEGLSIYDSSEKPTPEQRRATFDFLIELRDPSNQDPVPKSLIPWNDDDSEYPRYFLIFSMMVPPIFRVSKRRALRETDDQKEEVRRQMRDHEHTHLLYYGGIGHQMVLIRNPNNPTYFHWINDDAARENQFQETLLLQFFEDDVKWRRCSFDFVE